MDDVPGEESRDERAGVPLLVQFLSEVQKPEDLVIWGWDRFGLRRVVALRELRLAAVLFAEEGSNINNHGDSTTAILGSTYTEELRLRPPFPGHGCCWKVVAWSQVSLLDLARRFGHYEVARTLSRLGIKSRALTSEDFQAGTFSNVIDYEELERFTHHEELGDWKQVIDRGWARVEKHCHVNGNSSSRSQTNSAGFCPWPEIVGQWASDWDMPVHVARGHVDTLATRLALTAAAEGELGMLQLDEADAKLRLLDAALLLGHAEAAVVLAELCGQMKPLRIWAFSDLACISFTDLDPAGLITRPSLASPQYLEAHAAAGAVFKAGDFQDYLAAGDCTLLELVVLGGHVKLASLMKVNEPTRAFETSFYDPLGFLDFNAGTQTCHVYPAALDVLDILGIGYSSLKFSNERLHFPIACTQCYEIATTNLRGESFLFLAILLSDFGQVARMTAGGADLSIGDSLDQLLNERPWNQEVFCGNCRSQIRFGYDSALGLRWKTIEVALASAFHAALDKVKKCTATVARGGFVQQMNLMTPLAYKIFGFAAELPSGLQRLRSHCLSSLDKDPLLEIVLSGAASSSTEPSNERADQSPAFASEESVAPLPAAAEEDVHSGEALSKEDDLGLAAAMQQSDAEAVAQELQEVHKAVLLSKAEGFSSDHIVLWRLKKCSARVSDALSTSDELSACHDRVREAGCELMPTWAGGAVLLVPLTLELYEELGLKFAPYHVLSLSSDRERLEAALRSVPVKKRPTVSSDHRAALLQTGTGDLGGIRGDSGGGAGQDQQESDEQENGEDGRSEVSEAEDGRSQGRPQLEIVRTFFEFPLLRDVSEASSSGLVRSAPEVSWGRGEDEPGQGNQQRGGGAGGGGILSSNPRRWGGKSLSRSSS